MITRRQLCGFLLTVIVCISADRLVARSQILPPILDLFPPVAEDDNATTNKNTPVSLNVVSNDRDPDLLGSIDASTVDLNTGTPGVQNTNIIAQGSFSVNASGVVTFTPANNFTGTASLGYTVKDNSGAESNVATITITVLNVNTVPVASNDNATTNENTAVTVNVVANDSDSDGTINSATVDLNTSTGGIQSANSTAQGSYTVNASGVVTYTPANNFTGTATLSYTVNDNGGATSNQATISITVQNVNNVPVAANDNATTNRNTAVMVNVVANDTDSDGTINAATVDLNTSSAGIQSTNSTAQGGYTVNGSGIVTYTPANNYTGTATLNYTVNDDAGATSNAATITITVQMVNAAPVAVNDDATTTRNTAVTINVVANDTDSDGTINAATVDLNTSSAGIQNQNSTAQGNYSVNASGVVTFTPANNYTGSTSLNYTVSDNVGAVSNVATISVNVEAVNAAPVAVNDNATTTKNTAVTINVVANDTDSDGTVNAATVDLNTSSAGIQNTNSTAQGNYSVNASGVVTFTPANNYVGTATTNYTVNDNSGATSNAATITLTVQEVNAAPVAVNDSGTTPRNTAVTINVVANDSDSDGTIDPTKVDLNTSTAGIQNTNVTAQGSYSVNASGVVTFTPANNYVGTATTNYTVNDNSGATSNAATISITVQEVNAAPVAVNDNATTTKNTEVTINVVANDTDSDGTIDASKVDLNTATGGIQSTNGTTQGSYSASPSGIVTFTPANNYVGTTSLNYTVNDNSGATSNAATITVTVQSVNSAPVAINDNATTSRNVTTTINVVANDTDSDGTIDASKVDLNTSAAGIQNANSTPEGSYTASPLGVVTYTPTDDFTGTAALAYTVNDNAGATSNAATISIQVQAVNSAPMAGNDNATTSRNLAATVTVLANDTDPDGTLDASTVDLNTSLAGIQNTRSTGQGSYSAAPSGVVTFTPANNYVGTSTITYTVNDNAGATSNAATITITIQAVNNAPVAVNDNATTTRNLAVAVNAVANDTDSDGSIDPSKVDLNTQTAGIQASHSTLQGTYTANSSGVVTFAPANNFTGTASVEYTVNDNAGATSNVATITIAVQAVNSPPVASADSGVTERNTPASINVVSNDTDSDGTIDAATVDLNTTVAGIQKTNSSLHGTFSANTAGIVTFVPQQDFLGTETIGYTVNDNLGATSNIADISFAVSDAPGGNHPPEIVAFESESDTLEHVLGSEQPLQITSMFDVVDQDDSLLTQAVVGVWLDNYESANDQLLYTEIPGISGTFDALRGALTLTGKASLADYIKAVKSVRYVYVDMTEVTLAARTIYVRVSDGKSLSNMKSRIIALRGPLTDLDIPTSFTPNGDGANETWKILPPREMQGQEFSDAQVRVFDRHGILVYEAQGFDKKWDGTRDGKGLPADTYYYTIDLKNRNARYKGVVAILK